MQEQFQSKYVAKKPDARGFVEYTPAEHAVWRTLYQRQLPIVKAHACPEYLAGIETLGLSADAIPQLVDVSNVLLATSGWQVVPVPALISHQEFFELLASRRFPAATFIRTPEDLDYIQEPDIFHELFGHCPLLTNPIYANFMHDFAKMVLEMDETEWPLMQRIFWFTVEFGLIETSQGVKAYGGGILSSPKETVYSVESPIAERRPFDLLTAMRTPYRIDIMQPIYYVIKGYEKLYDLVQSKTLIMDVLKKAHELGEFSPAFLPDGSANEHIHFC